MKKVSILALWMEFNNTELDALRNAPINICNIAYRRFKEQKKRDMERAYQQMSTKENKTLKQRMAEINKASTGDGETPPPSPPPE
jgi:hypothetical protein